MSRCWWEDDGLEPWEYSGPGEVVEFDTHAPHVIANRTGQPTELLALFGPQGERMHVRSGS